MRMLSQGACRAAELTQNMQSIYSSIGRHAAAWAASSICPASTGGWGEATLVKVWMPPVMHLYSASADLQEGAMKLRLTDSASEQESEAMRLHQGASHLVLLVTLVTNLVARVDH